MAELAMTVADVAKALGISKSSVYEMVRKGQIPALHVGVEKCTKIIIPRPALIKWLERAADDVKESRRFGG